MRSRVGRIPLLTLVAVVALLEIYARLLGAYDWYVLKRDHRIWEPAESSKEMIVREGESGN